MQNNNSKARASKKLNDNLVIPGKIQDATPSYFKPPNPSIMAELIENTSEYARQNNNKGWALGGGKGFKIK